MWFKAQVYLKEAAQDQTFTFRGMGSTENIGLCEFKFLLCCLVCHLYSVGVGEKAKVEGGFYRWILLV